MSQENNTVITNPPSNNQTADGTLEIVRLYVKEQSAKVPHAPGIYQRQPASDVKPETSLEINVQNQALEADQHEVNLKLHLTMKIAQQTAMVIEVQQAGVFKFGSFDAEQKAFLLGSYCPGVLFPYARKVITDLSAAAGFLPITLPAINFDAMYQQRQQQSKQNDQSNQTAHDHESSTSINETVLLQ